MGWEAFIDVVGVGDECTLIVLIKWGIAVACVITARIRGRHWRRQRQGFRNGEESTCFGIALRQ